MYRMEGRFSLGEIEYDGSFVYDGIKDYTFELRGLFFGGWIL
jgi:hypothetical protein